MPETYHSPESHHRRDYEVPPDTPTIRVQVRCGCGIHARAFKAIREGIEFLRRANPPPSLPVLSYYCRVCKETVVVTARQLGLAA